MVGRRRDQSPRLPWCRAGRINRRDGGAGGQPRLLRWRSGPALARVNWTTSDATVLSVSAGGVAKAVGGGTATLTATSGSISGSTAITVTAANFSTLTVTPRPLRSLSARQCSSRPTPATPTEPPKTLPPARMVIQYPADAAVGSAGSGSIPPGLVSGLATWAPQITSAIPWELAGVSPTANVGLTVNAAAVVTVAVYPANPTLQTNETQQFNVWGISSRVTPNPPPIELSSRPEDSHLRALPDPYVNLSIHTAPDVRPFP